MSNQSFTLAQWAETPIKPFNRTEEFRARVEPLANQFHKQ